jgi:hypothetical protein
MTLILNVLLVCEDFIGRVTLTGRSTLDPQAANRAQSERRSM